MKSTKCMLEAAVTSPRINHIGHTELADVSKSLKPGMVNQFCDHGLLNGNKSMQRVVNYLFFHRVPDRGKGINSRTPAYIG